MPPERQASDARLELEEDAMSDKRNSTASNVVTRKQFLRGAAALGGVAVAGHMGLLSSIATAQQPGPGGKPKKGGTLAFNLTGDPQSFDPLSGTSTVAMGVIAPCYNGLVRYDPSDPYKIIPDLASSWEIAPDGKSYTFRLIKNVKFHDGKPMTSADVKYTFDVVRDPPKGTISARKDQMSVVDSIEALDETTVRFNLKRPSPSFLSSMANGWMLVMPKHILEVKGNMKNDMIGTGPFKLQAYNRGSSVELVRNPNYHVQGLPYLDGVTAYIIPDSATTWSYLQTGQIQWFVSIQGQDAGAYKTGGNVVVQEAPATSFIGAVFNTKVAPFDNIKLRKAMCLAIDRNAGLQITYNGQGELGGISVPGPWAMPKERLHKIEGYAADGKANIEEAKRLMAEAGHAKGLSFKMIVRKNPLFEPVGVFLKDQWAKIGINATIDIQENAAFADKMSKGDFNVAASGGSYSLIDPDTIFADYICGGGLNNSGICATQIDALYNKQSATMDLAERVKLTNEMEELIAREYGVYVMYWRKRFMGNNKNMHGMLIHPNVDQNMRLDGVWLSS